MFLRILAVCLIGAPLMAQVAQPKLNDLEIRKHQMIDTAQTIQASDLDRLAKTAAADVAALQKASDAFNVNLSDPSPQAMLRMGSLSKAKAAADQKNTQAQAALVKAQARAAQLQGQADDWEATVLESHDADSAKYKVDWANGTVVQK